MWLDNYIAFATLECCYMVSLLFLYVLNMVNTSFDAMRMFKRVKSILSHVYMNCFGLFFAHIITF